MKILNEYKLDAPLIRALEGKPHEKIGDISVTRLLAPLRQTLLMERYRDSLEMEASDCIWMFLGTIGHTIMEQFATQEEGLHEELLAVLVTSDGIKPLEIEEAKALIKIPHDGIVVSGKYDRYADGELTDYKLTKVWSHIFGSRIDEWRAQLSIYATMLSAHDKPVTGAHILEFLVDWNKQQGARKPDYPDHPIYKIPIDLWPLEKTAAWMIERTSLYAQYRNAPLNEFPLCSEEERWARKTTYAVFKNKTLKRAHRVFDSVEEANTCMDQLLKARLKAVVRERTGKSVRCQDYCLCAPWCTQWAAIQKEVGDES